MRTALQHHFSRLRRNSPAHDIHELTTEYFGEYLLGWRAKQDEGLALDACPFQIGTLEADAWAAGWHQARKDKGE